jgi:hypothetical protein
VHFEERWSPPDDPDPHSIEYRKKLPTLSRVKGAFKRGNAEIVEEKQLPHWHDIYCNSMMIERSAKHSEGPVSRVGIAYIPNELWDSKEAVWTDVELG